jgi:hypothetical protein
MPSLLKPGEGSQRYARLTRLLGRKVTVLSFASRDKDIETVWINFWHAVANSLAYDYNYGKRKPKLYPDP